MTFSLSCFLALTLVTSNVQQGDVGGIEGRIAKLRSLSDDVRRGETRKLADEIHGLPASATKTQLAGSLANLATEGDFGSDTLQAVTDALSDSLKETPAKPEQGHPNYAYTELAQLNRYEGMRVDLDATDYKQALAELDATDQERKKVDFSLIDMQGKSWKLSELKGKVVIVNFWATWCPPCRKEMPDLDAIYGEFKNKDLVILAISDEESATVKKFIDEKHYTYPILLDPGRTVNTKYKIEGIPKSFIYDRSGKMVAQTIDMRTRGQFVTLLQKAGLDIKK